MSIFGHSFSTKCNAVPISSLPLWGVTYFYLFLILFGGHQFFSWTLAFGDPTLISKAMVYPIDCALCRLRLCFLQITQCMRRVSLVMMLGPWIILPLFSKSRQPTGIEHPPKKVSHVQKYLSLICADVHPVSFPCNPGIPRNMVNWYLQNHQMGQSDLLTCRFDEHVYCCLETNTLNRFNTVSAVNFYLAYCLSW